MTAAAAVLAVMLGSSSTTPRAQEARELARAWAAYRKDPSAEHALSLCLLLPPKQPPGESLTEEMYASLPWLGARVSNGDRPAVRVAFRLCSVAHTAFAFDLHALLGSIISRRPLDFLLDLLPNRTYIGDLAAIVASLDTDKLIRRRLRHKRRSCKHD